MPARALGRMWGCSVWTKSDSLNLPAISADFRSQGGNHSQPVPKEGSNSRTSSVAALTRHPPTGLGKEPLSPISFASLMLKFRHLTGNMKLGKPRQTGIVFADE